MSPVFYNAAHSLCHCPDHNPWQRGNVRPHIDQHKISKTGASNNASVCFKSQIFDLCNLCLCLPLLIPPPPSPPVLEKDHTYLCTLPLHPFIHRGATCSWWPLVLATFSSCSSSSPATSSSITSFTQGPFDDDCFCPFDASFLYQSNCWFQPFKLQSVEYNQRFPLLPALVHISR